MIVRVSLAPPFVLGFFRVPLRSSLKTALHPREGFLPGDMARSLPELGQALPAGFVHGHCLVLPGHTDDDPLVALLFYFEMTDVEVCAAGDLPTCAASDLPSCMCSR